MKRTSQELSGNTSKKTKVAKTPGAEDSEMTQVGGPGRERARSMVSHFFFFQCATNVTPLHAPP